MSSWLWYSTVYILFPLKQVLIIIEIHSTGIEPADIDPLRGNAMSTTQRALRLECTSIWCLWLGFAPYSTVVQNYRVIVSAGAAAPSSSSTLRPTVYTHLLYVTNLPYWNTLNPLYRQIQFRLVDARPPLDAGGAFNILQYGVLSSFPGNWRSSHSPSSIVGLMRFCLGSIVTSNDLPPDLHSNHIEIHLCQRELYSLNSHGWVIGLTKCTSI